MHRSASHTSCTCIYIVHNYMSITFCGWYSLAISDLPFCILPKKGEMAYVCTCAYIDTVFISSVSIVGFYYSNVHVGVGVFHCA